MCGAGIVGCTSSFGAWKGQLPRRGVRLLPSPMRLELFDDRRPPSANTFLDNPQWKQTRNSMSYFPPEMPYGDFSTSLTVCYMVYANLTQHANE